MDAALEKRIKRQIIGKPHRFLAVAPLGFEQTLANELKHIGVETASDDSIKVAGDGKVEFTAKITEAWKAVAYSRIANRILMEIASFKAENFGQLEKHTAEIPWELYLDERRERKTPPGVIASPSGRGNPKDERGLGVEALGHAGIMLHTSCKHSRLYHSDAVEERILKIITEKLSEQFQTNSSSQSQLPANCHPRLDRESSAGHTQHLYINLQSDRCTIWQDLAGEELYKRGHDRFVAEAPLKETIAAAMIFESLQRITNKSLTTNHQPLTTIIDPMAGSGTFSLEAAYIANGLIPGKCRDFALKHQPAFKEGSWNFILKGTPTVIASEAKQSTQSGPAITIITSDISERPINIIKHNVEASPLAEIAKNRPDAVSINPQLRDFFSYTVKDFFSENKSENQNVIILLNPPYGKRLNFDAPKLYEKIGKFLQKEFCEGNQFKAQIHVAILIPKGPCYDKLIQNCTALNIRKNPNITEINTSHGGFSLSCIIA